MLDACPSFGSLVIAGGVEAAAEFSMPPQLGITRYWAPVCRAGRLSPSSGEYPANARHLRFRKYFRGGRRRFTLKATLKDTYL